MSSDLRRQAPSLALMVAMSSVYLALLPVLPAIQDDNGFSTASIGLLSSVGFIVTVVAELTLGPQADRGHGAFLIRFAVVALALSMVGHAFATELWQFCLLRGLAGAAFGAFVPSINAQAIRSAPERAGEQLGRLQAADLAGLAVGPMVVAFLLTWVSSDLIFVGLGAVLLFCLPLASLIFPNVRVHAAVPDARDHVAQLRLPGPPVVVRSKYSDAEAPSDHRLPFDLLSVPGVAGAVLLMVAVMIPVGAYDALWPRFLEDIDTPNGLVGVSYALFAAPYVLVAPRAGRLADRVGGLRAQWIGVALFIPIVVGYAVIRNPWTVTGMAFAESAGQAVMATAAAAAVAHAVPVRRAGAGQALARSTGTVFAAAVAALSGPVYAWGGAFALFGGTAVLVLITMLVATVVLRRGMAVREELVPVAV